MTDLSTCLKNLNETSDSIKSLYFRPPGIFTNSIIRKIDIITLLRDADSYENSLYYIDKQGIPERKDGTRGIVDKLNEEFEEVEFQQQQRQQQRSSSVIIVPKQLNEAIPENKVVKNLLNTFNEEIQIQDYEVDKLIETVFQLLDKYPIKGMNDELIKYQERYNQLINQIIENEGIIENQRQQLSTLNIKLNSFNYQNYQNLTDDIDLTKGQNIKDLIAKEEQEIRQLELELDTKTKQSSLFQ
ncbi:hypothetical protein WICMUC_004617 [Wickerhamomyces mucosus]|uniref:DASH complex subunit SPC34 n=1 Tax=Wickerhamomyces mucosus TaxID=1378264 RepID=A0A9P8PGI6_9ASCO|nr:hypothetical protein WICMUC_004617 [Wickerhamomyces mucosus]